MSYKSRLIIYAILAPIAVCFFMPQLNIGNFFLQHNYWWLCVLIRTFLIAFLLCPLIELFGLHFKFVDMPDRRKIHDIPIPRIGGMAVYIALIVIIIRYIPLYHELMALLLGTGIIFIIGMLDDMFHMPTLVKLAGQLAAAAVLVASGITIDFIPSGPFEKIIEITITFIWLIGITNAINFLDGINGLCSGLGAMNALIFLVLLWNKRQDALALVTVSLAGGCLGFIPYNFKFWMKEKRASLFLGDEGSTLIGFLLAGIAVMGSWAENNPIVALSTPLLILGIPIFDMIYTTISRIKNSQVHTVKEWLDYVGKDHFHHRLLNIGFNHKGAVLFILALNLCLGLSAIIISRTGSVGAILLLSQAVIIFLIIVVLMIIGRQIE